MVMLRLSANGRFSGWAVFEGEHGGGNNIVYSTSYLLLVLCLRCGSSPFNKQPSFNSPGSLSLQEGP